MFSARLNTQNEKTMDRENNNRNNREERSLRFVLRFYAPGLFDTRRAIRTYNSTHFPASSLLNRYALAGIAASVAICLIIGYHRFTKESESTTTLYAENSSVTYTLPDGSDVTLSPHSTLSYSEASFGTHERHVTMTGIIEFNVARDTLAPFIADAALGSVKVLGTQFTIDGANPDSLSVSVTSGKVLFSGTDGSRGVVLTRGMQASLTSSHPNPEIITDTIASGQTAAGKLIFDNTPISDVLKTLSEHFNVTLTTDATDRTLSAEFDTENLDEIIMLIQKSLGITITQSRASE